MLHLACQHMSKAAVPSTRGLLRLLPWSQLVHQLTLEALNAVQLSQQLIDHTVCDSSVVMAPRRCDGIKLVKKQHARSCSLGAPELQQINPDSGHIPAGLPEMMAQQTAQLNASFSSAWAGRWHVSWLTGEILDSRQASRLSMGCLSRLSLKCRLPKSL